jgi:hypothetical protein
MAPHPDVGRIGLAEARRALGQAVTEAGFQRQITDLADYGRWRWFHDNDSRRNRAGVPDLMLVKAPRLIFVEVKKRGGKVTDAQQEWLDELGRCTSVESYVWFPDDVDRAKEVLL